MDNKIVFTGGGSGGHVFPGLAVISELKKKAPSLDILWLGSNNGMEKRIVEDHGIPFAGIPAGKLRRYFSFRTFLDAFRVLGGVIASVIILCRNRPAAIFSRGGYVTVPPVIAAKFLGIPIVTHESDGDPGLATKINSRFASKILVSYSETINFFSKKNAKKIIVTGNPVRKSIFLGSRDRGRKILNIDSRIPVVFIMGGSLGAGQINLLVEGIVDKLCKKYVVIHQMGEKGYVKSKIRNYFTYSFLNDQYKDFLATADVVVSRSGAGAIWEIASLGKASILIPLEGSGTRGDQVRNALIFEEHGAAIVMRGKKISPDLLLKNIEYLISDKIRRRQIEESVIKISKPSSAADIADIIINEVKG